MSLIPPNVTAALRRLAVSASPRASLRGLARLVFGLVIAAWMILVAAWLALHWIILPHIQEWRVPLQARISEAIGLDVRIGHIEVRSGGWVPAFELRDVELLDAQRQVVLRLPHVAAALSARSLLAFEPRFAQLLIDGAQLEVRRDAAGRIWVAGLGVEGGGPGAGDSGALDWFLRQREFAIRDGSVRWVDEQRGAPPVLLQDVQFVIRNSVRHHALRLDATPPPGWGERFSLRARVTQPIWSRSGDWRHWSGTAYASLPRTEVPLLRQYVTLPFELSEGDGALRAWIDIVDGEPRAATVDVALRAVALRLAANVEPLAFEQVEGRIVAQRTGEGYAVAVQDFGFLTGDGLRWPRSDMRFAWLQQPGAAPSGGTAAAQRLDVALMAQIAGRVPIGEPLRKLLARLDPHGIVSDFDATWQGPLDAPQRYRVKASMSGLSFAGEASPNAHEIGRPGLRNASITLDARETGGSAQVAVHGGAVEIPGLFADPLLALDALSARLHWKIEAAGDGMPHVSVQARDVHFANRDAKGEVTADWATGRSAGDRFPGRLDLDGTVSRAKAARVARYLPLELPAETRDYIERAVRGGTVSDLGFRIHGDLAEFPFFEPRQQGEFRIAARIDDVTLAYMPPDPADPGVVWPVMTKVGGQLVIDRAKLSIHDARGLLGGVEWSGVQGGIPNLVADAPLLTVEGNGRGALGELLRFVDTTPVGGWIGGALATAQGSGPLEMKLGLTIPLADASATTVKGSLVLAGNDVRMSPDTPLLSAVRGRVDFTQQDFTLQRVTARALGGDFSLAGGMRADGSLQFSGQGSASAAGLRAATELGTVARVAQVLEGQADYRFELGFLHGQPQIDLGSNLVGLAVQLPYPLEKAAAEPLELRYRTVLSGKADAPLHEALAIDIGERVRLQFLRELSGSAVKVLSGSIGVMAEMPQATQGVAANIKLPRLDVDAWEAAATRVFGAAPRGAATAGAASPGAAASAPAAATDGSLAADALEYLPNRVALDIAELSVAGRRLSHIVAGLSQEDGEWRANVDADQLNGYIEYRPTRSGAGRIYARLGRLSLPRSEVEQVETLLDQQPASVPALDIVVEDFELRGMRLGRAEVVARNRRLSTAPDAAREWQLTRLSLAMPEAQFSATGRWAPTSSHDAGSAPRRADLSFELTLADSGKLLDRLGFEKMLRGGKGKLNGDISWPGSPLTPDIAHMVGKMHIAIQSGQFLQAEPGVARLLGVLSLQSLPRRLLLDFRDVFDKGFAFDDIDGDVQLANGIARTNNLRMRAVALAVLMEGNADLERETQDLQIVVVPEINAGTASLAYAVINPAVGLGTFLAQLFLRKPLIAASTREFHISGSWSEPKVEKVERPLFGAPRRGDAASAPEASAPAASAPAAPEAAGSEAAGSDAAGSGATGTATTAPAGSAPAPVNSR